MTDNIEKTINKAENNLNLAPIKLEQKKAGRFLLSLAFLFSLGAIGGVGYLYYINKTYQNSLNAQVGGINGQILKANQDIQSRLEMFSSSLAGLESQVARTTTSINSNNLLLLQLNQVIGMANQSLVVYSDIKSTLKLLSYGLNLLGSSTNPQYVDLKLALNSDIEALQQLQYVDPIALVSKLNTVAIQIDTLKLINYDNSLTPSNANISTAINGSSNNQLWIKFWNNLKNTIKSIVVVSNTDSAKEIKLLPEKEIIVRQNLKLYILNARIALLQHDENAWKFNLENVKDGLNLYFNKSSLTAIIIGTVNELINTDISMGNLGIDATLKALNKLNSLR